MILKMVPLADRPLFLSDFVDSSNLIEGSPVLKRTFTYSNPLAKQAPFRAA
jgi:hypothetical protein